MLSFQEFWPRIQDYFFSVYENSLYDLALFTAASLAYFLGKHLYSNYYIRRNRDRIPLVLGGWGTRGKSGTERIKAAMINALGHGLVSKTTGCEAMFLYADPYGKMREMFLFRPYDKATIWEQANVMAHAVGLEADVFLWECMALTPSYVRLLQRQWVRDDVSTITNTFPDHEDLQGPAGINIPEVMTQFIPEGGTLLSSEEQMQPILSHAAASQDTSVATVGWLEAGLLTPDVLKRFPYDEHPFNIALVMRLGEELGIEPDFALKEMADRVVADLGVLKTYPIAPLRARRLEFVNGMSANERFGCISNWLRMGFDKQDEEQEPGVWINTVVNNRADRIARSRVFAGLLVEDISADRHFLIGSNLTGLVGYINEAWEAFKEKLTLWPDSSSGEPATPLEVFQHFARRYRVPYSVAGVQARLRSMLAGLPTPPADVDALLNLWDQAEALTQNLRGAGLTEYADGIGAAHQRNLEEYQAFQSLADRLPSGSAPAEQARIDAELRTLLGDWFKSRIIVIEDYYATGNQIVNRICDETPPGYRNKIMGIQNIKGTGLDFVYRWQAWDACHKACTLLQSNSAQQAEQGLRDLSAFQEFGLLCDEYTRTTVECVRASATAQSERFQAELNVILGNLDAAMKEIKAGLHVVRKTGGLTAKLISGIEASLDAGDAVRRRKTADKIYKDLIAERISLERAVVELQYLTKRQKGGWLQDQLLEVKSYLLSQLETAGSELSESDPLHDSARG